MLLILLGTRILCEHRKGYAISIAHCIESRPSYAAGRAAGELIVADRHACTQLSSGAQGPGIVLDRIAAGRHHTDILHSRYGRIIQRCARIIADPVDGHIPSQSSHLGCTDTDADCRDAFC